MNLTQIFRRIAQRLTPRHFGLLTGIFCIIGLFSALQLSSSFLLNASLNEAQRNEQQNLLAWQQQSKLDLARVSLLAASDLLNRSGVWFMQDKETGSDGSWHSLMDDAQKALTVSQQAWKAWLALNPPKDDALVNSYQLFYGAIKEQAEGLVKPIPSTLFLPSRRRLFRLILTTTMRAISRQARSRPCRGVRASWRSFLTCKRYSFLPRCC